MDGDAKEKVDWLAQLWIDHQDLIIEFGKNLLLALLIFLIGRWVARMISNVVRRMLEKRKVDATLVGFLSHGTYMALLTVVVISALGRLGVNSGSFIAIVGAIGLAIGFALQGSLANIAAGILLVFFRPFGAGDLISAAGEFGAVKEIQLFATVLITPDGRRIIVPNSGITGGNITNWTVEGKLRLDMVFGIGYGDDIKAAKQILETIMSEDERIMKDPVANVAVKELGDSSVNLVVQPWIKTADKWGVLFRMQEEVKLRFDAAGISIPFPQQDVHMHAVDAA